MEKIRRVTLKSGDKFKLNITCDMSTLTDEQVQDYAFDSCWIKEQSKLREMSNKALEELNGEYKFTPEVKGTKAPKVPKDPVKAAVSAIPSMTEEQKDVLRKALNS